MVLTGGSVTLRAASSAVVFGIVAAGAVLLIGDAALRGAWPLVGRIIGPGLLVVWAAWLLLVRPSIRVLPDRAVVVNVGRISELPWVRVIDIRRRLQIIFDLEDGRHVEAWGSPFVKRGVIPRRGAAVTPDDPSLDALRGSWMSGSGEMSVAPVIRRPDTIALALGGASAVACAVSLLVAR